MRAYLVFCLNKSCFFDSAFITKALHHKSSIFRLYIFFTTWFTFSLFFLFYTVTFNHIYIYELDIFEVIDYKSVIDRLIIHIKFCIMNDIKHGYTLLPLK